jgi:small subunit ribosomal protein S13
VSTEIKQIVRITGKDLKGEDQVYYALQKIKGIGFNTALAICKMLNINPLTKIGYLNDEEIKKIEDYILNLPQKNVPSWFLNRRKDPFMGKDYHFVGSDLVLKVREDIEFAKSIKSWKGIRHSLGLKVRGQSTRTTGRTGLTVGVTKKKEERKK